MKIWSFLLIVCFVTTAKAQDAATYWKQWNTNYPWKNIPEMLKEERAYAIDVKKNPNEAQSYFRLDKYKFKAKFLGQIKQVDPNVVKSIKRAFVLSKIDPSVIDETVSNSVLMKVGNEQMWMPIQINVLKGLKEEVKNGDEITIYCLFVNEHTEKNGLYNTFLISEFVAE